MSTKHLIMTLAKKNQDIDKVVDLIQKNPEIVESVLRELFGPDIDVYELRGLVSLEEIAEIEDIQDCPFNGDCANCQLRYFGCDEIARNFAFAE